MATGIDHYIVLGLPSGERGAKLSEQEIRKAYQSKARVLHPDKRRDDPNAHANFLKLQNSYHILKDAKSRKEFDALLRRERESVSREMQRDSKRRKMMSDLEEAERRSGTATFGVKQSREEEERYSRILNAEIARVIARHNKEKQEAAAAKAAADADRASKQDAAKDSSRFHAAQSDRSRFAFAGPGPEDYEKYVLEKIRRFVELSKSGSGSEAG